MPIDSRPVSLLLGKRSRVARPKAPGPSHAPSTWVSRPKGGLGQLWRKRTRSLFRYLLGPIIIPVPAPMRPVLTSEDCGAGLPAYRCNERMATRFRHDRCGDPPLSGPDSDVHAAIEVGRVHVAACECRLRSLADLQLAPPDMVEGVSRPWKAQSARATARRRIPSSLLPGEPLSGANCRAHLA